MWRAIETLTSLRAAPRLTVVALALPEVDRQMLFDIAQQRHWRLVTATTLEEALAAIQQWEPPVVICNRQLPRHEWGDAVSAMAAASNPPCILLASPVADSYLWMEAVRRGGYDLLVRPFTEEPLVRSVQLAWSYWKSGWMKGKTAKTAKR